MDDARLALEDLLGEVHGEGKLAGIHDEAARNKRGGHERMCVCDCAAEGRGQARSHTDHIHACMLTQMHVYVYAVPARKHATLASIVVGQRTRAVW